MKCSYSSKIKFKRERDREIEMAVCLQAVCLLLPGAFSLSRSVSLLLPTPIPCSSSVANVPARLLPHLTQLQRSAVLSTEPALAPGAYIAWASTLDTQHLSSLRDSVEPQWGCCSVPLTSTPASPPWYPWGNLTTGSCNTSWLFAARQKPAPNHWFLGTSV